MKTFPTVSSALVATAILAVASSASATGSSYTVKVGTTTTGQHTITASSTTSQAFSVGGHSITCASAAIPSTSPQSYVSAGSGVLDVATVRVISYSSCTSDLPAGPGYAVSMAAVAKLHGTSSVTSGSSDVVQGHLEGLTFQVRNAQNGMLGNICSFTMSGRVSMSFSEATQRITINELGDVTGQLKVATISKPCLGEIANGEIVSYSGTLQVSSTDGVIRLS